MAAERPPIGPQIEREVRQRCGFGCVVCGFPLYEYDHIVDYAEVLEHKAENITLLCATHHAEKTKGLRTRESVLNSDKCPYNLQGGVTAPYILQYEGNYCKVVLGGNEFTTLDAGYGTILAPIVVDGIPLVGFILSEGRLLLNLVMFDANNNLLLQIRNNALEMSTDPWDIEQVGQSITVRNAPRDIFVDFRFEMPNILHIERGRLLCNGVEIVLSPHNIVIANNGTCISGCGFQNFNIGLRIGDKTIDSLSAAIAFPNVDRYIRLDTKSAIAAVKKRQAESQAIREKIENAFGQEGGCD